LEGWTNKGLTNILTPDSFSRLYSPYCGSKCTKYYFIYGFAPPPTWGA